MRTRTQFLRAAKEQKSWDRGARVSWLEDGDLNSSSTSTESEIGISTRFIKFGIDNCTDAPLARVALNSVSLQWNKLDVRAWSLTGGAELFWSGRLTVNELDIEERWRNGGDI